MAEAIATVGLVASVIQITDFSRKFLKRLKQYEKANSLPPSFQAISLHLPFIIDGLQSVEAQEKQYENASEISPKVQPVLEACRKEIDNLNRIFDLVTLPPASSSWNRKTQALRSLRYESNVQQSVTILKHHIDMLMWHKITTTYISAPRRLLQNSDAESDNSDAPGPDTSEQGISKALLPIRKHDSTSVWEKHLNIGTCTCRGRPVIQKSTRWTFWFADFSSQLLSTHRNDCPFFTECNNITRLSFNLNYTSLVLRARAQIALSMQYGNGGIGIMPNLNIRGVRRNDSPAFALFDRRKWYGYMSPGKHQTAIRHILLRLRQLFESREASPLELDERGNTLMWAGGCNSYSVMCTFIQLLIDLGAEGDPVNSETSLHSRPATYVQLVQAMRGLPDLAEYLDCNGLQHALLSRSISAAERILRDRPNSVTFQNSLGLNGLHLTFDWPEATQLLISAGADLRQTDKREHLPISYACVSKSLEVVEILLANDCPLFHPSPPWLYERKNYLLEICLEYYDPRIFQVVASAIAQRRLELLQTAKNLLTAETWSSTLAADEVIPDGSASRLANEVAAAGCRTDPAYWSAAHGNVYHTWNLFAEAADILYEVGFTRFDDLDIRGQSPFTMGRGFIDLRMFLWFYQKNVSFSEIETVVDENLTKFEVSRIHLWVLRISFQFFQEICCGEARYMGLPLAGDLKKALEIALGEEFADCVDQCDCPCSVEGCDPLIIISKGVCLEIDSHFWNSWGRPGNCQALLIRLLQIILNSLAEAPNWDKSGLVSQSVVRLTLFQNLGLRHTCCRITGDSLWLQPFDEEEAHEIHEEDQSLIEEFETLLPLAQHEWEQSSKTFSRFWSDFYRETVSTYVHKPNMIYAQGAIDAGVRIYEDDEPGAIDLLSSNLEYLADLGDDEFIYNMARDMD
ncbi:MAG: hypothetical protein Q9166_008153 [cf. Caloplaca sp. 2 TL-2023]